MRSTGTENAPNEGQNILWAAIVWRKVLCYFVVRGQRSAGAGWSEAKERARWLDWQIAHMRELHTTYTAPYWGTRCRRGVCKRVMTHHLLEQEQASNALLDSFILWKMVNRFARNKNKDVFCAQCSPVNLTARRNSGFKIPGRTPLLQCGTQRAWRCAWPPLCKCTLSRVYLAESVGTGSTKCHH